MTYLAEAKIALRNAREEAGEDVVKRARVLAKKVAALPPAEQIELLLYLLEAQSEVVVNQLRAAVEASADKIMDGIDFDDEEGTEH